MPKKETTPRVVDGARPTELGVRILSHTANARVQDRGRDVGGRRWKRSDRGRGWGRRSIKGTLVGINI